MLDKVTFERHVVTVQRRQLSDPVTIRALAHPIRVKLLQLLLTRGPLTATEAGEAIGESPASASFHLRQLSKYGYIEETGDGTGRRRPWRAVVEVQKVTLDDLDPAAKLAFDEVQRVLAAHQQELHGTWLRTRHTYPKAWRDAATDCNAVLHLSAELAAELQRRLDAVLEDYLPSLAETRPPEAVPTALVYQLFPLDHPRS